jgi:hypothetical protein
MRNVSERTLRAWNFTARRSPEKEWTNFHTWRILTHPVSALFPPQLPMFSGGGKVTFPEWFGALLTDVTAHNNVYIISRIGSDKLQSLYEQGAEPCLEAILNLQQPPSERWRQLCVQIEAETNPEKVLELCDEVNRLLDEKEQKQ